MALREGSGERGAFSRSKGACQAVWPGKCRPLALVKPAGYGAKPSSCVLSSVAGLARASVVRAGGLCGSWAGSPYDSPRAMGVQTSAAVAGEGYGPCRAGQAQSEYPCAIACRAAQQSQWHPWCSPTISAMPVAAAQIQSSSPVNCISQNCSEKV